MKIINIVTIFVKYDLSRQNETEVAKNKFSVYTTLILPVF